MGQGVPGVVNDVAYTAVDSLSNNVINRMP